MAALDQGMLAVRSHGLGLLVPKQRITIFRSGLERLYFAFVPRAVGGARCGACVEDRVGARRLVLYEDIDAIGLLVAPTSFIVNTARL